MIDKLISFFDQDTQFKQVWQLKLIKFDIDLDEQVKPYQKYLAISHIVQDTKGNPGLRGHFYVTNLRFVWHGANDRQVNLSIGLDCINNVYIKPIAGGTQTKHILIVKTQSPGGSKYQFKFSIFTQKQIQIFRKAIQIFKEAVSTRLYRTIDTNLKVNTQTKKFQLLSKEQIFNTYNEGKYYESEKIYDVEIILTNIRIVIIQLIQGRGISYGIPWIMIQSYEKTSHWEHPAFQLKIRGLLSGKQIFLRSCKQFNKFESQFISLATSFSKNPILGIDSSKAISKDGVQMIQGQIKKSQKQIEQIFQTKINIKRNKNRYAAQSTQGVLADTAFNEQLGIMMQKLPPGVSRNSLWQILG